MTAGAVRCHQFWKWQPHNKSWCVARLAKKKPVTPVNNVDRVRSRCQSRPQKSKQQTSYNLQLQKITVSRNLLTICLWSRTNWNCSRSWKQKLTAFLS